MNRPSQQPSYGGMGGSNRPSQGPSNRPGGGNLGSPSNRPSGGGIGRPSQQPGNRPSSGDVGNFLGMPTQGGGGIGGGNRANGPASSMGNRQQGSMLGQGGGNRPSQLPSNRPGGGIGDRDGIGNRDGIGDRGGIGNQGRIGDRGGMGDRNTIGNRPVQRPARGDRNGWNNYRSNRATSVRNISGNNVNFNRVCTGGGGWWGGSGYGRGFAHGWAASNAHHGWGGCWGWHGCAPGAWWGVATSAVALGSFCVGLAMDDDDEPEYYNYGDTVYIENNTVYKDGQPLASEDQYATQAIQYASVEVPPPPPLPADPAAETPEQDAAMQQFMDNWMALGVFAVGSEPDNGAPPRYFLQLAVSKDGYIAGTCYDSTNDKTVPVTGSVDKASQRAAWKMADNNDVVMETGIYNLTQDTAPAMIHFGKDRSETRLLVRMEQPKGEQAGAMGATK